MEANRTKPANERFNSVVAWGNVFGAWSLFASMGSLPVVHNSSLYASSSVQVHQTTELVVGQQEAVVRREEQAEVAEADLNDSPYRGDSFFRHRAKPPTRVTKPAQRLIANTVRHPIKQPRGVYRV